MTSARIFGLPISCFYRDGKATGLGRAFSRFWAAWASLGLPPRRQVGLEIRGRRTGRPHRIAVVIVRHRGRDNLVSMLGECEWVRNARAAGEGFIIGRRRHRVQLDEVPVEDRATIIQQYLKLAPGARPHIGLGKSATLVDCERVAPRHPVFRILYLDAVKSD